MHSASRTGQSLLFIPFGLRPQLAPVKRGSVLRFMPCMFCSWPLMNPCPMCPQNPRPEGVDLAVLCPVSVSDDSVNYHRHCLKGNFGVGAIPMSTYFVPTSISYTVPYLPLIPLSNPMGPQGAEAQGPVAQGLGPQTGVQQSLMLVTQIPYPPMAPLSNPMEPPVASSVALGAPLIQMNARSQPPPPLPDSSQVIEIEDEPNAPAARESSIAGNARDGSKPEQKQE